MTDLIDETIWLSGHKIHYIKNAEVDFIRIRDNFNSFDCSFRPCSAISVAEELIKLRDNAPRKTDWRGGYTMDTSPIGRRIMSYRGNNICTDIIDTVVELINKHEGINSSKYIERYGDVKFLRQCTTSELKFILEKLQNFKKEKGEKSYETSIN